MRARMSRAGGVVAVGLVGLAAGLAWADGPAEPNVLRPPLPIWPSELETVTDRTPVFRLNGRFGAEQYRIELSRTPDFAEPTTIADGFDVSDTGSICPTVTAKWRGEPLRDGAYYWRAFAGARGEWTPAANYRAFFVAATDRDAIAVPPSLSHPYLLFTAADVAPLRRKIESDPAFAKGYRYLYNAAVAILDAEPPDETYARGSASQHGNYSSVASWNTAHLVKLMFVWHVSGEERFADKARELLLTICRYERWLGPAFTDPQRFNPPWNSALETAMTTNAVAFAYDGLYARLSDDERALVRDALVSKGIRALVHDWADPVGSSKIPRHQTATGNWDMVCACSAGVGALALLGEHDDAPQWVRLVRNRVRWWLHDRGGDWYVDNPWPAGRPSPIPVIGPSEPNFGPDGGYKESHGYMNYAMMYVCYFADALHGVTGEDLFTHVPAGILDPVAWAVYGEQDDSRRRVGAIDFGDCGDRAGYAAVYAALVKHRRDGLAQWLLHRTDPVAWTPHGLVWRDTSVPEARPSPAEPIKLFRGIGQVYMRSNWGFDDLLVGVKFHQNRGHNDLGTFTIARRGLRVVDSGVADYGGRVYQTYLSRSHAHNVVLIDGQGQQRDDGVVLAALATPGVAATAGELRAAYPTWLESWVRDVVVMPPGLVVTVDSLAGPTPHQYEYVVHPSEVFAARDDGQIEWGDEPATRTVMRPLFGGAPTVRVEDGYRQTLPMKYARLAPPGPPRDAISLPVVYAVGEAMPACEATFRRATAGPGTLVTIGGPADAVRAPAAFDGAVAVVALDAHGDAARAWLRQARRLDRGGRLVLTAADPIDAAVEWRAEGILLAVQAARATTIELAVAADVAALSIDGRMGACELHAGRLKGSVPTGCHSVVVQYRGKPAVRDRLPDVVSDLPATTGGDAPAFAEVMARAGCTFNDALAAIDGNPDTIWHSLPNVPMPQWFEIDLPAETTIREIRLDTVRPSEIEVLTAPAAAARSEPRRGTTTATATGPGWTSHGRYETAAPLCGRTITIPPTRAGRIRIVFHRIDEANASAMLREVSWK